MSNVRAEPRPLPISHPTVLFSALLDVHTRLTLTTPHTQLTICTFCTSASCRAFITVGQGAFHALSSCRIDERWETRAGLQCTGGHRLFGKWCVVTDQASHA